MHIQMGSFDCKKRLDQEMPRHACQLIYSKQVSRGQHRYGADVDWCVLDGVRIGATWRIRVNCPSVSVMSNYFDHLLVYGQVTIIFVVSVGLLWSPCVIGQTIIFLPFDFYLLSSIFFFFLA